MRNIIIILIAVTLVLIGGYAWFFVQEMGRVDPSKEKEGPSVEVIEGDVFVRDVEKDLPAELPSEDQKDREDPVVRYPGSVMLSYRSGGQGVAFFTEVDYGTADSADEVVEWYKENYGENPMETATEEAIALSFPLEEKEVQDPSGEVHVFTGNLFVRITPGDYTNIMVRLREE